MFSNTARCTLSNLFNMAIRSALIGQQTVVQRVTCGVAESPPHAPTNKVDASKCKNLRNTTLFNPACYVNRRKDVFPRFDDIYRQESDKSTRKYIRKWSESKLMFEQKKISCLNQFKPVGRGRRSVVSQTAFPVREDLKWRLNCPRKPRVDCVKTRVPGFKSSGRDLPDYTIYSTFGNCIKTCTPFPSFSECRRLKLKPIRKRERTCMATIP